ncbi:hypothetical protein AMS68_007616 [Peltaster fructicola]|uniref:Zn(2)-C6 fungal-type domain-containing protein n=1 Tax=Peltaster fructicola TaxID=286661 RepID=A0A6H0Y5J3_9PEZI|nr:hypothetical protein AMS68_007616 [Peltaster fructicola]
MTSRPQPSRDTASTTKRVTVTAACENCRKRKQKCSAERPKNVECVYETIASETHGKAVKRKHTELEARHREYEDFIKLLHTAPETEVATLLQQLRAGATIDTLLTRMQSAELLTQLSLVPETRYRYVLPVTATMPALLDNPLNPYINTLVYELTLNQLKQGEDVQDDPTEQTLEHQPFLTPYHAARVLAPNLRSTRASMWTSITSNDALVHHLLELYFLHEYPMVSCLHVDLFLADMKSGRREYCSPLLVNAVLASASHGYHQNAKRSHVWDASNITYRFTVEAKRLLEMEREQDSLTTIQALLILGIDCNRNAIDKVGWNYFAQAVVMARRMGLMSALHHVTDSDERLAKAKTGWAVFTWQSMMCYHIQKPSLCMSPPVERLPSEGAAPTFYGEVSLTFPLPNRLWSMHHGITFRAFAQLYEIVNELNIASYSRGPQRTAIPADEATIFHDRLAAWLLSLPEPLLARNICFPVHLQLHMFFYNVLISFLEPLVEQPFTGLLFSDGASADRNLPSYIVAHARACINTLLRLYFLRHGFAAMDTTVMQFFNLAGFDALQELELLDGLASPEHAEVHLSTVVLCAKGLCDQGRNFYLAEVVYRIFRSSMQPEHVQLLHESIDVEAESMREGLSAEHIRAEYPIKVISFADDPSQWRISELIATRMAMSVESTDRGDVSG